MTFQVNLTNAPSITGYFVLLTFNVSVIDVATDSLGTYKIDFSNNVLASTGGSTIVSGECINGQPIQSLPGNCASTSRGSILLGLSLLGGTATTAPTSGLLLKATFKVVGFGVSQLHLSQVVLANGIKNEAYAATTSDGYFTNIDCPSGSGIVCTPPLAIFTSSSPLNPGSPVLFNGSLSRATNLGASIRFYVWDWGELALPTVTRNPLTTHTFGSVGSFTVDLRVNDTYGITAVSTRKINVVSPPPKPDFTINVISISGGNFLFRGRSISLPVSVSSMNGFHGTVSLSVADSVQAPLSGYYKLTFSFGANSLDLKSGGSNFTELVITAPNNASGTWHSLTVDGTSGTILQSAFLTVVVIQPEIAMSCYPPIPPRVPGGGCFLVLAPGENSTLPIFVTSLFGFTGNVTFSLEGLPYAGFGIRITPSTVELGANETRVVMVTITAPFHIPVGFYPYAVVIRGESPDAPSTAFAIDVDIELPPLPPDVAIIAPTSVQVKAGENAGFRLDVTAVNGLPGNAVAKVEAAVLPQRTGQISISILPENLNLDSGLNSTRVEVSTANATQPGTYVLGVLIEASYETVTANGFIMYHYLAHSLIITLRVLLPATPPVLAQFHWKHWVSLSRPGLDAGTQTFVVGVINPNNSTVIYAQVRVSGTDRTGQVTFTTSSTVLKLLPRQRVGNVRLTQAFDQDDVGRSFQITAVIDWGMNRSVLNLTSDQIIGLNPGSFSVII